MARPSSKTKTIDSLTIPKGMTYEGGLRIKPPEGDVEKSHRIRMELRAFWIKDASVYVLAKFIVVATLVYCFSILWQSASTAEDRKWARSTVSTLLVGVIAYLFGKASQNPS